MDQVQEYRRGVKNMEVTKDGPGSGIQYRSREHGSNKDGPGSGIQKRSRGVENMKVTKDGTGSVIQKRSGGVEKMEVTTDRYLLPNGAEPVF